MRRTNTYLTIIAFIALFSLSLKTHAILNGHFDAKNKYESVVKVYGAGKKGKKGYCSGVLIHPRVVLTVSHCHESFDFVVSTGDYRRHTKKDKRARVQNYYSVYKGSSYKGHYFRERDFAVLILESEIKLSRYPKLVASEADFLRRLDQSAQSLILTGFGKDESGVLPHKRMFKSAKFVDLKSDPKVQPYKNYFYAEDFAAPGDSGGAVFVESGDELYLMGVISGNLTNKGSRLMKIFAFEDWLYEKGLDILNSSQSDIDYIVERMKDVSNVKPKKTVLQNIDILESTNHSINIDKYEFLLSIDSLSVFQVKSFNEPVVIKMSVCSDESDCFTFRKKAGVIESEKVINKVISSGNKPLQIATIGWLKENIEPYGDWDYISISVTNGDFNYGEIRIDFKDYLDGEISYKKINDFKDMALDLSFKYREAK